MFGTILFVVATSLEGDALRKLPGIVKTTGGFSLHHCEIKLLVTGVGSIATAWSLNKWLMINGKPDLIINAGIAGSFNNDINIGDVVMPVTDCFADSGIENGDKFFTLFESGLADPDEFPYRSGILHTDKNIADRMKGLLKAVNAITVNGATGSDATANKLLKKYNPDIETMEGATFFYLCSRENIPFLALRAISNRVETRNRSNWNIPLAMQCLSEKLKEVFIRLE